MGKRKTILKELVRAIMLVSSIALSILPNFIDLSFLGKNSVGIGIAVFILVVLWYLYDLQRKYLWVEPDIILTPSILNRTSPFNESMAFAILTVFNDEEAEITDCYATLEQAINLYGGDLTPIELGKKERLKWVEAKYSTNDCKIAIAPKNDKSIHVANNSFNFAFCMGSSVSDSGMQGLYIIKIRIDGKWHGKDIKPQFFDGHLLMDRTMTDSGVITRAVFNSGDWTKNKEIPDWYRKGKVLNDRKNRKET